MLTRPTVLGPALRWAAAVVSLLIAGAAIATDGWLWLPGACAALLIGFAVSRMAPFVMQRQAGTVEHLQSVKTSTASGLTGVLEIRRTDEFRADRNRSYIVVVDKTPAASIRAGETIRLDVAPGAHAVRCHIDWCSSRATAVRLAQGEEVALVCRARSIPVALLSLLFCPGRYLRLATAQRDRSDASMSEPTQPVPLRRR